MKANLLAVQRSLGNARWCAQAQRVVSSPWIPVLLGLLLLVAALLKGYQLTTTELKEQGLLTTRWFLVALVLYEFALGIWFITDVPSQWMRGVAIITFLAFIEAALYQVASGEETCNCMGTLVIRPLYAVMFDGLVILALLFWRPTSVNGQVFSLLPRLLIMGLVFALVAVPSLVSMLDYAPVPPIRSLRNDPRLSFFVPIHVTNPSSEEILNRVEREVKVRLVMDAGVVQAASAAPPKFGVIESKSARAWALMELVAQKQPVPCRWETAEGGYRLVRAAPFGRVEPWIFSASVLLAVASFVIPHRLGFIRPC